LIVLGQIGMQRILVTGNAGSGKTFLASILATQKNLPYFGLDSIVWKSGWVKTPPQERQEKELAITNSAAWVLDGVSLTALDAADLVVFLDYPRLQCLWRALLRSLPYLFRSRPGLPENCPEIIIFPRLLKIIWRFPKHIRPKILAACRHGEKTFWHVRNNDDLKQFLISVDAATHSNKLPSSNS